HEEIERSNADKSRWKPTKVGNTRRHCRRRDVWPARLLTEKRFPAEAIAFRCPSDLPDMLRHWARGSRTIVEHGINKHLKQYRNFAAITRCDRKQGRVASSCTVA